MADTTAGKANKVTWLDLASPDLEASKRFYGQIFGWEAEQVAGPEAGNYTFFKLQGKQAAGLAAIMGEGQPPAWMVYIMSPNVDQTAEGIRAAGGEIVMGPMDVMDAGRMCVFRDPTGAYLALWQPGSHTGTQVSGVPGSISWVELQTRDMPKATQFYRQVFGWEALVHPMEGGPDYTEWQIDGVSVGGGMDMTSMVPAEVPPNWLTYFQVESADRTAEQIKQHGGTVMAGPMDSPGGRFVVALDPQGAAFGVLEQAHLA